MSESTATIEMTATLEAVVVRADGTVEIFEGTLDEIDAERLKRMALEARSVDPDQNAFAD